MRGCPIWKTSRTLPIAITAPSEMIRREMLTSLAGPPENCSAVIIGSAVPRVFQGAIPVITTERMT